MIRYIFRLDGSEKRCFLSKLYSPILIQFIIRSKEAPLCIALCEHRMFSLATGHRPNTGRWIGKSTSVFIMCLHCRFNCLGNVVIYFPGSVDPREITERVLVTGLTDVFTGSFYNTCGASLFEFQLKFYHSSPLKESTLTTNDVSGVLKCHLAPTFQIRWHVSGASRIFQMER